MLVVELIALGVAVKSSREFEPIKVRGLETVSHGSQRTGFGRGIRGGVGGCSGGASRLSCGETLARGQRRCSPVLGAVGLVESLDESI